MSILTSLNVVKHNSTIFPAVNLIDELDIAIIKTKQSFLFPSNRYQSTIYEISPTFLHWKKYGIKKKDKFINY